MTKEKIIRLRLSDKDLIFHVEAASPNVGDKSNLKKIIREDQDFRNSCLVFGDQLKFKLNKKHESTKHRKGFIIETFFQRKVTS